MNWFDYCVRKFKNFRDYFTCQENKKEIVELKKIFKTTLRKIKIFTQT